MCPCTCTYTETINGLYLNISLFWIDVFWLRIAKVWTCHFVLNKVVVNYVCLSLCIQASQEQCSSHSQYTVVGCQSKDALPLLPYKVPAFYTETKEKQCGVLLLRVLECFLFCAWLFVECMSIFVLVCVLLWEKNVLYN